MKNVNANMLKTCIFLDTEQYTEILQELFGPNLRIEFSMDGIWTGYDGNDLDETGEEPEIFKKLAEYFDVSEITSVHMDDSDQVGIWVCYKE